MVLSALDVESNAVDQVLCKPDVQKPSQFPGCCERGSRPRDAWPDLVVSRQGLFQNRIVQSLVCDQLLETGVLPFQLLQSLGLIGSHPAVLAPPLVVRLLGDPNLLETCPIVIPLAVSTSAIRSFSIICSALCRFRAMMTLLFKFLN